MTTDQSQVQNWTTFNFSNLIKGLLTDVINDALDGCNIADLITSGACFRHGQTDMDVLSVKIIE